MKLSADGYSIVSGLIPDELLAATREMICAFVGADLSRPETWYRHAPLDWSVVPIHQHQAQWDIRQVPALHDVFARLWDDERLWVSMDRCVFKVPRSTTHPAHVDESVLHWDMAPRTGTATYQGMLYLTDAPAGEGTFQCVPSIYRDLDRYLATHGADAPVDVRTHAVVDVPLRAGDLIVWSSRLPHHGGPNLGARPRLSMAVTMFPEGSEDEREERVACWQTKRAPPSWRGWRDQIDPEPGEPAKLSPLGRRLLGLDRWPAPA